MSGIASIVLAFWAAYIPPANTQAGRTLLWIAAAACFVISSYRIWSTEHRKLIRLQESIKDNLIFEIVDRLKSSVLFRSYPQSPNYGTADIRIRFTNRNINKIMVTKLEVSLLRKTWSGKERAIPTVESYGVVYEEASTQKINWHELDFLGTRVGTANYQLSWIFEISKEAMEKLNKNCFLRITMEAMRQPPYSIDLDVDWKQAISEVSTVSLRTSK
jgi:hypothetical protein